MKIKSSKIFKVIAISLCFLMFFEQSGFAQIAGQLDISGHITTFRNNIVQDKFRPLHLRYLQYDPQLNNFNLLLDKGNSKTLSKPFVETSTQTLLNYFFIGVTLPNDSFWVNLRPDSPNDVIDPLLAQTDIGKILLEADVQLKKDTAKFTSPETPEGKEYWDKLYEKAGLIFGSQNVTIPTLTRPWIVPNEIILRETADNAYIYKATLKVMLEEDYLKGSAVYNFKDDRLKELNAYASQVLREKIIPKLTQEINTSKRYAGLRQVYYSLILAQWFKERFKRQRPSGAVPNQYTSLIDRKNLTGLTSKESWSKITYFQQYQKSFKDGEYNFKVPMTTPYGQVVRSYFSGGIAPGEIVLAGPGQTATLPSGGSFTSIIGNRLRYLYGAARNRVLGVVRHANGSVEMNEVALAPAEEQPTTAQVVEPAIQPPAAAPRFLKGDGALEFLRRQQEEGVGEISVIGRKEKVSVASLIKDAQKSPVVIEVNPDGSFGVMYIMAGGAQEERTQLIRNKFGEEDAFKVVDFIEKNLGIITKVNMLEDHVLEVTVKLKATSSEKSFIIKKTSWIDESSKQENFKSLTPNNVPEIFKIIVSNINYPSEIIIMESIPGKDLGEMLDDISQERDGDLRKQKIAEMGSIFREVGKLVRFWHDNGRIHGGLRLDHIFLKEGIPVVIDFEDSYTDSEKKDQKLDQNLYRNLATLKTDDKNWFLGGWPLPKDFSDIEKIELKTLLKVSFTQGYDEGSSHAYNGKRSAKLPAAAGEVGERAERLRGHLEMVKEAMERKAYVGGRLVGFFNGIAGVAKKAADTEEFDLVFYPGSGSDIITPTRFARRIITISRDDIFSVSGDFVDHDELIDDLDNKLSAGMHAAYLERTFTNYAAELILLGIDADSFDIIEDVRIGDDGRMVTVEFNIEGQKYTHTHFTYDIKSDFDTSDAGDRYVKERVSALLQGRVAVIVKASSMGVKGEGRPMLTKPFYQFFPEGTVIISDEDEQAVLNESGVPASLEDLKNKDVNDELHELQRSSEDSQGLQLVFGYKGNISELTIAQFYRSKEQKNIGIKAGTSPSPIAQEKAQGTLPAAAQGLTDKAERQVEAPGDGFLSGLPEAAQRALKKFRRVFKRHIQVSANKEISDVEVIEFSINYLQKVEDLLERKQNPEGIEIITISDKAQSHSDTIISRLAGIAKKIGPVSFKGSDGAWRIVGFEQELKTPGVLESQQKEIEYQKKQDGSFLQLPSKAMEETGSQGRMVKWLRNFIHNGPRPIAAISDIHANIKRFNQALEFFGAQGIELAVLVGDYIDKGENNKAVLERIKGLIEDKRAVALFGNHDLRFVAAMLGKNADPFLFVNGGSGLFMEIMKEPISFRQEELEEIKNTKELEYAQLRGWAEWMCQNFKLYHLDDNGTFYVHSGLPVDKAGQLQIEFNGKQGVEALDELEKAIRSVDLDLRQQAFDYLLDEKNHVLWGRGAWYDNLDSDGLNNLLDHLGALRIVNGHRVYHQGQGSILFEGRIIGIDHDMAGARAGKERGGFKIFDPMGISLHLFHPEEDGIMITVPVDSTERLHLQAGELDRRLNPRVEENKVTVALQGNLISQGQNTAELEAATVGELYDAVKEKYGAEIIINIDNQPMHDYDPTTLLNAQMQITIVPRISGGSWHESIRQKIKKEYSAKALEFIEQNYALVDTQPEIISDGMAMVTVIQVKDLKTGENKWLALQRRSLSEGVLPAADKQKAFYVLTPDNVPQVFYSESVSGEEIIVMEAIRGNNLREEIDDIDNFEDNKARILTLLLQAGRVLRQWHDAGYLHGDFALAHIRIKGSQLVIIDYDQASFGNPAPQVTKEEIGYEKDFVGIELLAFARVYGDDTAIALKDSFLAGYNSDDIKKIDKPVEQPATSPAATQDATGAVTDEPTQRLSEKDSALFIDNLFARSPSPEIYSDETIKNLLSTIAGTELVLRQRAFNYIFYYNPLVKNMDNFNKFWQAVAEESDEVKQVIHARLLINLLSENTDVLQSSITDPTIKLVFENFHREITQALDRKLSEAKTDTKAGEPTYEVLQEQQAGNPWKTIAFALGRNEFRLIDKKLSLGVLEILPGVTFGQLVMFNRSEFFRDSSEKFFADNREDIEGLISDKLRVAKETGRKQIVRLAVMGAAFGQEPIASAIKLGKLFDEMKIDREMVDFEIHVFDLPGPIYDRVKHNSLGFSAETFLLFPKEFKEHFVLNKTGGFVRGSYLNEKMRFHDINLLDANTFSETLAGEFDIVTVHNVLQYLRPEFMPQERKGDFKDAIKNAADFIGNLTDPKGILSIYTSGNALTNTTVREIFEEMLKKKTDSRVDSKNPSGNIPGGIDLRALPITTQPMNQMILQGQSPMGTIPPIRIPSSIVSDKEWQQIENMVNAGIKPSLERIREYLILSCKDADCQAKIERALSGIADILRLEEEHSSLTDKGLKEILVLLESNKPAEQLSAALSKIIIASQEPVRI